MGAYAPIFLLQDDVVKTLKVTSRILHYEGSPAFMVTFVDVTK